MCELTTGQRESDLQDIFSATETIQFLKKLLKDFFFFFPPETNKQSLLVRCFTGRFLSPSITEMRKTSPTTDAPGRENGYAGTLCRSAAARKAALLVQTPRPLFPGKELLSGHECLKYFSPFSYKPGRSNIHSYHENMGFFPTFLKVNKRHSQVCRVQ